MSPDIAGGSPRNAGQVERGSGQGGSRVPWAWVLLGLAKRSLSSTDQGVSQLPREASRTTSTGILGTDKQVQRVGVGGGRLGWWPNFMAVPVARNGLSGHRSRCGCRGVPAALLYFPLRPTKSTPPANSCILSGLGRARELTGHSGSPVSVMSTVEVKQAHT